MPETRLRYNLDISKQSIWLTITAAPSVRVAFAYVQELGDFYCGENYNTWRENLPSYLIKLCISGEGVLEYEGRRHAVKPGQMFWIDCEKQQYYYTLPDIGHWRILWVHFSGAPCKAYYDLFLAQNNGSPLVSPDADISASSTLNMLINLYQHGGNTLQDDVTASSLLTQLMTHCILASGSRGHRRSIPEYVINARNFLTQHYAERITLDDLASVLSINKFYLQKLFKKSMGVTPNEYLVGVRLTHAKQLLRTSSCSIGQIASDVGIHNNGHFIELFKSHEGITPSAYRKRWYSAEGESPFEGDES